MILYEKKPNIFWATLKWLLYELQLLMPGLIFLHLRLPLGSDAGPQQRWHIRGWDGKSCSLNRLPNWQDVFAVSREENEARCVCVCVCDAVSPAFTNLHASLHVIWGYIYHSFLKATQVNCTAQWHETLQVFMCVKWQHLQQHNSYGRDSTEARTCLRRSHCYHTMIKIMWSCT